VNSAFGIEHTFAKGLKPANMQALGRVVRAGKFDQKADYAGAKLALRTSGARHQNMGQLDAKMTMRDMSRTRFGTRQTNKNMALKPGKVMKRFSPKEAAKLAGLGAATAGVSSGAGGYLSGRIGRSNRVQSKKIGRAGGATAGAFVGLAAGGPVGVVPGALAGGYAGGHAAQRGATTRIRNNEKRKYGV